MTYKKDVTKTMQQIRKKSAKKTTKKPSKSETVKEPIVIPEEIEEPIEEPIEVIVEPVLPQSRDNYNLETRTELTVDQMKTIELMASGMTIKDISDSLHISNTQIYEWKNRCPKFKEELNNALEDVIFNSKMILASKTEYYINEMENLYRTTQNEKLKLQILQELLSYTMEKGSLIKDCKIEKKANLNINANVNNLDKDMLSQLLDK